MTQENCKVQYHILFSVTCSTASVISFGLLLKVNHILFILIGSLASYFKA